MSNYSGIKTSRKNLACCGNLITSLCQWNQTDLSTATNRTLHFSALPPVLIPSHADIRISPASSVVIVTCLQWILRTGTHLIWNYLRGHNVYLNNHMHLFVVMTGNFIILEHKSAYLIAYKSKVPWHNIMENSSLIHDSKEDWFTIQTSKHLIYFWIATFDLQRCTWLNDLYVPTSLPLIQKRDKAFIALWWCICEEIPSEIN